MVINSVVLAPQKTTNIGYTGYPVTFVENHSHCDLMESMVYKHCGGVSGVSDVYLSYSRK
jgi:hypothetical protein